MTRETAKEILRKTKVIRDNFYPEPIEPKHEDELQVTFEFLSEVINYLENDTDKLSVEKLQEQLNTAKKALTEIIFFSQGFMPLNILLLLHKKHSQRLEGMMNNKRISEIVEEEMIKQDANRYRDMRKILTIPKSIADLLDKFIEFYFDDVGHEDWWIQENGLIEWFSKTPNCYIKDAYLAGKALGVDLVKVV